MKRKNQDTKLPLVSGINKLDKSFVLNLTYRIG